MRFSIVVPVYNVEKYLSACVESILSQTFRNYELVLVDDGSTDHSGDICNEYAEKYEFIRVIHKPNGGQSTARNAGLEAAKGDYIVYLDSDDFLISDRFLSDLNEKCATEPDVVQFKFQKYYDNTGEYGECGFSYAAAMAQKTYPQVIQALVQSNAYHGMAWLKAVRRDLLLKNGIRFQVGISGEDTDWNYQVVFCSSKIEFLDEVYLAYRQRPGSVTTKTNPKLLSDFLSVLEKWAKKIEEETKDEALKIALLGSLAEYCGSLLILYSRVRDLNKKQYRGRVKSLCRFLKYGMSARPRTIYRFYKVFGFGITEFLLRIKDR